MSNAIKHIPSLLLILFATACGPSAEEEKADEAQNLADQISRSIDEGRYSHAIELIDSLNNNYPDAIELRQSTLLLRAKAIEGQIRDSIPIVDAERARIQEEYDSMKEHFIAVREEGLPGYIVDKAVSNVSLTTGNVLQPRVGDSLSPWVLEISVGTDLSGILGIRWSDSEGVHEIFADNPNIRQVNSSSRNMLSLNGKEVESFAKSLDGKTSETKNITVIGSKRNLDIKVSPDVLNAIWRTYRFTELRDEERLANIHRELLERKLITAQNQIANLSNN